MPRRPVLSHTSARVCSSRSARRAPSATSAPASAMAWAKATPRPEDAPVTTATLPVSLNKSVIMAAAYAVASRALAGRPRDT